MKFTIVRKVSVLLALAAAFVLFINVHFYGYWTAGPDRSGRPAEAGTKSSLALGSLTTLTIIMLLGVAVVRESAERTRTETALAEAEERLRLLVDGIREYAVVPLHPDGSVAGWNEGAKRIFGYEAGEIVGRHFSTLFTEEENSRDTTGAAMRLAAGSGRSESENQVRLSSGASCWAAVTLAALRNEQGDLRGFSLVMLDISDRRQSEESLRKLTLSLDQATDLVVMTDRDGTIEYINKATEDLLGYSRQEVIGRQEDVWIPLGQDDKTRAERGQALQAGKPFQSIVTNRKKSGELISLYQVTTPLKDVNGCITHHISTARDITQQKSMEERLNYLAFYDALTGIPNRTLFIDRLTQGVARARYGKKIIGVLIIDIDRFKYVNDVYGMEAGDRILKLMTQRLEASIREGDTLARLGSDDFGILLFDVAEADDIIHVVKKIMDNVTLPVRERGEETVLTSSIGIAVYPYDGESAQDVMKNADMALTNAKQQGSNAYRFYTRDMNSRATEFASINKQLFNSFRNREFMIYYQPYWSTATQKLAGLEALIRWNSRHEGVVPPSRFIPVLEDTGMIIEVGDWITKTVCRQIREWQDARRPAVPVSVNISPVQFRKPDITDRILEAVRTSSIDPNLLTLEITESTLMRNFDFARQVLVRLKQEGISISLDDFGTGYSSLSYLQKFPFDNLKIDISFVRELALDGHSSTIVSAIIAMARSLSLKTIAEGVETEELWKILRLLQCDMVQGNYFSPPLPPRGVEIFFE